MIFLNDALKKFIESNCPNIDDPKSERLTFLLLEEIAKLRDAR